MKIIWNDQRQNWPGRLAWIEHQLSLGEPGPDQRGWPGQDLETLAAERARLIAARDAQT